MNTSVIGYPRIGKDRELKFASEKFFAGEIDENALREVAKNIRKEDLLKQKEAGITYISSNDFSFYDNVLDTAFLFNIVPQRYKDLGLSELETYFALARGYQGEKGNVKALAMKKWFNTNYHYLVPEIDDDTEIRLTGDKPVNDYVEAKLLGVETKVALIGPFTFLRLVKFTGSKKIDDVAKLIEPSDSKKNISYERNGEFYNNLVESDFIKDYYKELIDAKSKENSNKSTNEAVVEVD